MSINPTDFPGRFTGHAPVPVPLHLAPHDDGERAARQVRQQTYNAREVECLLNYTSLPHPVIEPHHEYVHVMVADIDDLGEWLYERGGEVRIGPEFMGVRPYILVTHTDEARDGSRVEIRVTCAVPLDAAVMSEIAAAVAR
ncbi:hypothetical protein [Streptomyces sp. NRRL S-337]|uniref:hypothetical protein n=1 Tax=Streptomyces sp. NRRL S-337 TaxID=1463900 RepID=UPI000562ABC0|nr:hypothetical protein [Streptomyces sp. NRRL S-337]